MTSWVNDISKWRYFCKSQSALWKLTKLGTDDCYNKVKKFTKFQRNADIFDGDMTSSNFDVMSDNDKVQFKGSTPLYIHFWAVGSTQI